MSKDKTATDAMEEMRADMLRRRYLGNVIFYLLRHEINEARGGNIDPRDLEDIAVKILDMDELWAKELACQLGVVERALADHILKFELLSQPGAKVVLSNFETLPKQSGE